MFTSSIIAITFALFLGQGILGNTVDMACELACSNTNQGCMGSGGVSGCCSEEDVCIKKNFRFAQCKKKTGEIPSSWDGTVINCQGGSGVLAVVGDGDKKEDHDHSKDHKKKTGDPNEGKNCPANTSNCRCAGKFWRCADKADPIVAACDIGLECVRKNKHYAVCATPERKAKLSNDPEWEGTILPCGVNVATF